MKYIEMSALRKGEICWYSFISGLCQHRYNKLINIIIQRGIYISVEVHMINNRTKKTVCWIYRFSYDEIEELQYFLNKISAEFSVEIINPEGGELC